MKSLYSFVIDEPFKFEIQARVFIETLLVSGIERRQIVANYTPATLPSTLEYLESKGIILNRIDPFLDGKYCNKIAQLDYLICQDADFYVLCDTDLAFLQTIENEFDPDFIRAKPVDLPNPPLGMLEELRQHFALGGTGRIVQTTCADEETWSVNCNGGLYIIPRRFLSTLANSWKHFARSLFDSPARLGSWRTNIDQISFALAMIDIGQDVRELPVACNVPIHLAPQINLSDLQDIKVLHYHWMQDENGFITKTQILPIDQAIDFVNDVVRDPLRRPDRHVLNDRSSENPLATLLNAFPHFRGTQLLIHAGASKTGTTSLQFHLNKQRAYLRENGVVYPHEGTTDTIDPKHQWIVTHLCFQRDDQAFSNRIRSVLNECDENTKTIILSTEGIYNHWWDFSNRDAFKILADFFQLKCLIWLREPVDFVTSLYLQNLKNPRIDKIDSYGRDLSADEMLQIPWFRKHIDYDDLLLSLSFTMGSDHIFPFFYSSDTSRLFYELLGLEYAADPEDRRNVTTLNASGVDLLRLVNRHALTFPEKSDAFKLVKQLSSLLDPYADKFRIPDATIDSIRSICRYDKDLLLKLHTDSMLRWKQIMPT